MAKNSNAASSASLANFVWSIADQLRGPYKPHEYGDVILPMTILRRLDSMMVGARPAMRRLADSISNPELLVRAVRKETGLPFYNTSDYDFQNLLADSDGLAVNLSDYASKFSPNIDVFGRFDFPAQVDRLAEKERLYLVVKKFAAVNLHPDVVPNAVMGDMFEELIRKFAEASNETAGEHYTPRDAIRLMVDLLFAEDGDALLQAGVIRSVYDPTAGTGGMLSVAEEHMTMRNSDSVMRLYGQEINDQSYAICKSDMIAKGQDASNIQLGDTLANDLFADRTFDFCLSNPPFGVDWRASEKAVKAERARTGIDGRFGPGLPKISDGQMLFLSHIAHKMRPPHEGGGRAAIVLNGSPLFAGSAEQGESEIRRWLLENDLVDAIVALPLSMFYNTGIATYVWLLDNAKRPERQGKIQLIDGTSFFIKMKKSLGDKSREISEGQRSRLVEIYAAFEEQQADNEPYSRVLDVQTFGYYQVTVERPLRGEDGAVLTDRKGVQKPDPKLRDIEIVPFDVDPTITTETTVNKFFVSEVAPYVPDDAWIDHSKTRIGYEIPFSRHFFKAVQPRSLDSIDADLNELAGEIMALLQKVEQ